MKSPYWDVTITGRSDATVNGVSVEMVVPTNVYSSVFQHLATAARQAARPLPSMPKSLTLAILSGKGSTDR